MSFTFIILIITIAASAYAWSQQSFFEKWKMIPYQVKNNNEYYRFLTSGFIHADIMHLAFNMLAFFSFGIAVERVLGSFYLLIIYIGGIIVSDIPTYLKYKDHPHYASIGASGGVASIIFSSILMHPLNEIRIWGIPISGFIFAILYLIYSYYQAKNSRDNVNHDAHFYGAVFGIICTVILVPGVLPHFIEEMSEWRVFN